MDNTLPVQVSELSEFESWIPQIAQWHHAEWLKAHVDAGDREYSEHQIQEKLAERERSLARHLSDEAIPTTYIAHVKGAPIGTVSVVYYQITQGQRPTEWLTNLYVLPEYRRSGIATLLLAKAVEHAEFHHVPRLLLYTNDQVQFYRKRRWRSINRGVVQGQKVEIMDYTILD